MMRKVLGLLAFVVLLGLQVQASIYVDASTSNTVAVDGSDPWYSTGNTANLWYLRTGTWANNDSGIYGQSDGDVFESREDVAVKQLVTTISGLTAGQMYQVDIVFESKSAFENWCVTADFNPIQKSNGIITSGITYGFAADDTTLSGVSILAGVQTGDVVSGIYKLTGLVGYITADENGQINIYVDNCLTDSDANHRTWYDGLIVTEVPEPATMALLSLGAMALIRRKR